MIFFLIELIVEFNAHKPAKYKWFLLMCTLQIILKSQLLAWFYWIYAELFVNRWKFYSENKKSNLCSNGDYWRFIVVDTMIY